MKPLFRITPNRRILLDKVISPLKDKVELKEGFGRVSAQLIPDEQVRASRLAELEIDIQQLKDFHDALETVASHNHEFHLRTFRLQEREWKTEWDVPEDLLLKAIEYATEQLKESISRSRHEDFKTRYKKAITMLQELKEFRMIK